MGKCNIQMLNNLQIRQINEHPKQTIDCNRQNQTEKEETIKKYWQTQIEQIK